MLEARDVSLVYHAGGVRTYAVEGVSLSVSRGEFCGIIGPSGNGKSSLLYLLSGLRAPSGGTVLYEGRDYRTLGARGLADLRRRHFGFVFQQHFLIGYLTVLENVMLAGGRDSRRESEALLRRLGLGDCLNRFPWQLSGGQRQRVAVARALARRPSVVFADEPTASLDQRAAREVVSALEEYHRGGGTVVLVTHDPAVLRGADRVLTMRAGRILGG